MSSFSKSPSQCSPRRAPLPPIEANTHAADAVPLPASNLSGGLNGAHLHIAALLSLHVVIDTMCIYSHITSNKYFFSSFNNVDPSHMMLIDCYVLCCQECGPIAAVWRWRPPWSINLIAFYLAFLSRYTRHSSANAKSNQKPITYPTKYLHQYLADEDGSSHHLLRMYGGQTLVPYGCTYLLLWGWRLNVNGQNREKTSILR